jgi:predicted nucleotidyltransferase component of viral defense system
VESPWFSGRADVLTFATPELFATKTRALYQRSKGRDLFDMWLALTELDIPGREIVDAFPPYRPKGITAALSEANQRAKLEDDAFRTDLDALVAEWPADYDIDAAAELVISDVLRQL